MQKKYELRVDWIAFPLHPDTPPEGRALEDLFAGRGLNITNWVLNLKRTADELKLPFGDRTMTFNSRLAQELAKWAASKGCEKTYHAAVFEAYFAHGLNIGNPTTLISLAAGIGLPADEAERVIKERTYRDAVDRDWAQSIQMGVTAVPTVVLGGRGVVGAQPMHVLEKMLDQGGVVRRR